MATIDPAGGDAAPVRLQRHRAVRPAARAHGRVEHDALAEPLGEADRDQLRATDDARVEAEVGLEEVVDAAGARDHPEPAEEGERVRRLGHEPAREERAQQVAGVVVVDLALQPRLVGDRVELGGVGVVPGRLRVERGGEGVELGHGADVRLLGYGPERRVVTRVPVRASVAVDVDAVALAVGVEELQTQVAQHRVRRGLVRGDPLPAELVRLPADLGVPRAAADAVTRLEHDDVASCADERVGRREPGDPGPDDGDVCLDRGHGAILAQVLTVRSGDDQHRQSPRSPAARCSAARRSSASCSSRKRRSSSQTMAEKSTSACSVDIRMPPRFWSCSAEMPHSRSGRLS